MMQIPIPDYSLLADQVSRVFTPKLVSCRFELRSLCSSSQNRTHSPKYKVRLIMASREDEKYILYGGPDPLEFLQDGSLGEMMLKEFLVKPDNIGLIDPVTEVQLTYRQILQQSIKVAVALTRLGIQKTDRAAIISDNCLEFCIAEFGSIFASIPVALLNPAYVEAELEHAINLSKPKVVFVSANVLAKIAGTFRKLKLAARMVVLGEASNIANFPEAISFSKLLEETNPPSNFMPEPVDVKSQVAVIVLSSGTTGLPKGVELTHLNIMTTVAHAKETRKILDEIPDQLNTLAVTPLFHAMAAVSMINMVTNDCRCVVLTKFDIVLFLESIQKYKVNLMTVAPPLLVFLAKHPIVDNYDLSSLITLICGAAPLSKEIEDRVRDRIGVAFIRQGYGLSETTLGVLMQTGFENKAGCVGQIRMGQWVKVIDPETGKILGPNQRGELCFKGSLIMKGYVDEETVIDADGWLHTGDIGYYDDEHDFFIVDRIKELIKYKGFQVPPAELEAILIKNPKIKDAAVIGIADERVGELATAFVVKEDDVEITAEEIVQYMASQVSPQKQLHGGVRFIDEVPRTISGKILRRELREFIKNTKSKL
ncbi:luciferin 4-monooxygenase-like [Topomyia yanbarensis]|uniref:luciferin 4-monooxygenase-like n=1 Tax=Topomyia yanbarensis TaxID=2498891 RepID=UPI00273C7AD3|nr:luciferin 4-monooxygenase-like [Topomyia yanbarensis]